jgi:hypothetical protein
MKTWTVEVRWWYFEVNLHQILEFCVHIRDKRVHLPSTCHWLLSLGETDEVSVFGEHYFHLVNNNNYPPPSSIEDMEEKSYTSTHPLGHTGPLTGLLYPLITITVLGFLLSLNLPFVPFYFNSLPVFCCRFPYSPKLLIGWSHTKNRLRLHSDGTSHNPKYIATI